MKKRLSPQEKKKLAYERDHYVSGGESRHGFRKKWPKKKAMMNQMHRHRAARAIHQLEKLRDSESIENSTIELTAEQLRKIHPKEKLFKWGVRPLKEHVERNQANRQSRTAWNSRKRQIITERCKVLVLELERDPDSPRARAFLREVEMGGGWGWDFSQFLKWYPEWRPRLERTWLNLVRAKQKTERKRQNKEGEKQRVRALQRALQRQTKSR